MGLPFPLQDYLAPFAQERAFFRDGFCSEHLALTSTGIDALLSHWQHDVQGFFNLLSLEMWGRLHIYRQPVDALNKDLKCL